jgi:hypothetical protein
MDSTSQDKRLELACLLEKGSVSVTFDPSTLGVLMPIRTPVARVSGYDCVVVLSWKLANPMVISDAGITVTLPEQPYGPFEVFIPWKAVKSICR